MTRRTYPMKCLVSGEGAVTRVEVYDDIGDGGWFSDGLSAKSFAAQLAGVKGPLDVHINSAGGDVGDGIAIGNTIRGYKGYKRTIADGIVASIASVIFQAGDERVAEPGSMIMVHDALTQCIGNAADMQKTASDLDEHSNNIASIYARRAGGTIDHWRDIMRSESWFTAEKAVAAGLADRVGDGAAELPAGFDLGAFDMIPGRIAARLRALPQAQAPVIVNADGNHAPMSGTHAHSHPAYGTQGGDTSHSHEHAHDGDASHGHSHAEPEPDGTQDAAPGRIYSRDGRLLGLESMPVADKALPVHHTATVDKPWDGPAAVAAMPNDDTVLEYCHAWQSDEAASVPHREGDDDADDQKGNYKFPHHAAKGGPANVNACSNGLSRLSGADVPDADRAGIEAHLRAHLKDAGHSDADDSAHLDLSGIDLEQIRSALRGATA